VEGGFIMSKKFLLLVEDDRDVQIFNKHMLEEQGYTVEASLTLAGARGVMERRETAGLRIDAIILDRGMPDGSGLDLLEELRTQGSKIPVLMLTGYDADIDVITGYDSGCDDYVAKPYSFGVLSAKLKRLLEQAENVPEYIIRSNLKLNPRNQTAYINDKNLLLTKMEFNLLLLLVENEGKVMPYDCLYEKVWGQPMNNDKTTVLNTARRIINKLDGAKCAVENLYGKGYCFQREQK
jgi:DNA-binding response OmpR family regulator